MKAEDFLASLTYPIAVNASPLSANVAFSFYLISPNYRTTDPALPELIVNLPHDATQHSENMSFSLMILRKLRL